MTQRIILEDPTGEYWPGSLVTEERANALAARGVASMPVEPSLFHSSAVAGFFRRDWGAGWGIPMVPGPCAAMLLYTVSGLHTLNWSAKIVPTPKLLEEMKAGKNPSGLIRLVTDSGQVGVSAGGLSNTDASVVDLSNLGEPGTDGWIVQASARTDASSSTMIGYTLYGHAREMRVAWAALSQTE